MSTDFQRYSTENQADVIAGYAAANGIEIVRTYSDEGRSGLNIEGREGLQRLIADAQAGGDFEIVLVYDVSRFGRFQDADESAYYEYLVRRTGVRVIYVAEQFDNDGSPIAAIIKSVKRAMAGEYSRELSTKVFAGQCRLIELGFRQGGPAGYGLRRVLLDSSGTRKAELAPGEQKSLQTDRVVLEPGPAAEVATVRRIYRLFVEESVPEREIAERLNREAVPYEDGRPWSRGAVHRILINGKYAGDNIYNRLSFKLKKRRVRNPPSEWVRRMDAFPAVVERSTFDRAAAIIAARAARLGDADMLELLRGLLAGRGALSGMIIDEADGLPSSGSYAARFGGLLRAYTLIGYEPERDYSYVADNRRLRDLHPDVIAEVERALLSVGARVEREPGCDLLLVNREFTLSIVIARCTTTPAGAHRWRFRFDAGLLPDLTVAVRMDTGNTEPLDYYLFPAIDLSADRLRLADANGFGIDAYRCDNLSPLYDLAKRADLKEAA